MATDERVRDRLSGKLLDFSVVGGREAKASGLADADPDERYIAVQLPRPVPADGGEVRLLIEKTYQDPKSYLVEAEQVVFTRSSGSSATRWCCPRATSSSRATFPPRSRRRTTAASW